MSLKVNSLKTVAEFTAAVDNIVKSSGSDYIDAVVQYCDENEIDIEVAASIIKSSSRLKSNIRLEAENVNMVSKSRRLPV